jgi:hypothetical protein
VNTSWYSCSYKVTSWMMPCAQLWSAPVLVECTHCNEKYPTCHLHGTWPSSML